MSGSASRDLRQSLAGIAAAVRPKHIRLRFLPGVAEVEAMLEQRGAAWLPAFEAKRDAVSRALFGITEADTRPVEPHPDHIKDESRTARYWMGDAAWSKYNEVLGAWHNWQTVMAAYEASIAQHGAARFFARHTIDVTDGHGDEMKCLPFFVRQMYVAVRELLPQARLNLSGTGKPAPASVDDWAAALEAEAARFRPSR